MGWKESTFPDADDPQDVGWMIMYWRIVPCTSGCKEDYMLEARQFDHLPKSATPTQARALLASHVANRREGGKAASIKGLNLFLCKVDSVSEISDFQGNLR